MNPAHESHEKAHRVPFARFFLTVGLQTALAFGLFWLLARGTFQSEFAHPGMIVLWTFLLGVPLSLFEYLYHRYLLHSSILPFLGSMHRAHGNHHGLTYVKAPVSVKEPAKLVTVDSEFPVVHEHQEESMMFPAYSLAIFFAMFTLLIGLPGKLLLPGTPMVSALLFAVVLHYSGYELWHAVLHLPYDRFWQPMMEGKRTGKLVKYIYSFHLMHHWRPTSNLAVVGFWGFAMWDHLFRTHRRPHNLPLDGASVNFTDATLKKPLWPIAMLDRWQAALYKWSRRVENFAARVFLRRRASTGD